MTYIKSVCFLWGLGGGGGLNLLFGKDALNWSNLKTFNMLKKNFFFFCGKLFQQKK